MKVIFLDEFNEKYRNFVNTGQYNLSIRDIPKVRGCLNHDIASKKVKIDGLKYNLKKERPPLGNPYVAVSIKQKIEDLNDRIEDLKERKKQLVKLRKKSVSKKPNQIPSSKTTISPPLARPMIKDTGDWDENSGKVPSKK